MASRNTQEVWTPAQYHAYLAGTEPVALPRFLTLEDEAPEDALRSRIQALCKVTGHLYFHPKNSRQSTAGFPDDVIVHPEGGPCFFWELKRAGADPKPAQRQWLEALDKASHIEVGVYRPCDWEHLYTLLTRTRDGASPRF